MNSLYLILGSEAALADRALTKIAAQLQEEKCEITTLFAADAIVGDIADALAPSLFSERRALIIRDLQDLPEDSKDEVVRYLDSPDPTITVVFIHKGGVKGKALLDTIKKLKPDVLIPMHCSGLNFVQEARAQMPDNVLVTTTGSLIGLGA